MIIKILLILCIYEFISLLLLGMIITFGKDPTISEVFIETFNSLNFFGKVMYVLTAAAIIIPIYIYATAKYFFKH